MSTPVPSAVSPRPDHKLSWPEAAALVVWMAVTLYWAITYSGPYRWLSEWQMRQFGHYLQFVSMGVPLLAGWGATALVLRRVLPARLHAGDASAGARTLVERFDGLLGAKAGAAAIFLLFAGLALHVRNEAASYGVLRQVTADDMAGPVASRWVEITGWPDTRSVTETKNGDEHVYFGLRSARDAADDALVPVFVEGRPEELADRVRRNMDGSVTIRGLVWRSMEAPVRRYMEEQGVKLALDPWVLNPLQTPEQQGRQAPWILGMGVVIAGGVWLRFRKRAG
ncbi:hypothetical protein [Longimicrobium sp.]|uniref:hypothetical protein n=1 Tax=Longimicrobium sp. TaxID=2029185 RepID=UPI002D1826FA|nr:hypothetical protein [Longimicrobium sp.]HSU16428.1 hypothetical protein [Longimicrobium sp.]